MKKQALFQAFLKEGLSSELQRQKQKVLRQKDLAYWRLMPDSHLSKSICVGSVLATRKNLYPAAIGSDIGCGMLAIAFDSSTDFVQKKSSDLLHELKYLVPIMKHSSLESCPQLPDQLAIDQLHCGNAKLERTARIEAGTLGRGNHFLEFQKDTHGQLWLMLHTGSRGVGQSISHAYSPQESYSMDSPEGQKFWADMNWAIDYAQWNRHLILERLSSFLEREFKISAIKETLIECQHDHIAREIHFGEELFVHRKGANRAQKGDKVIIAGSMGTPSFHVTGRGFENSLRSCSHGAGRCMSRTEARRFISENRFLEETQGVIFPQAARRSLIEESPSAYKNIHKVMRAQKDFIKIDRELQPILSYKGS